ncbi:MAG: succinate dehydrogenase, hydrophobic membrane anchor protein [Pseudomonadota bacterium]
MVNSATTFGRSGLSDWLIQRISAVILGIYVTGLLGWLLCQSPVDYATWQGLHACLAMRIANTIALLALIAHAWIGVWTILTDYVTSRALGAYATALRIFLEVVTFLWLFGCLLWGAVIIWAGV